MFLINPALKNYIMTQRYSAADNTSFITTWETTSPSESITLPLYNQGVFDFIVDWGDGNQSTITAWDDADKAHTYDDAGTYTVTISGACPGWSFNNGGDKLKIKSIEQWGDNAFEYIVGGFYGCSNLECNATDSGNFSSITNFQDAWNGCSGLTSFPLIDTSSGTSFYATWAVCSGLTSFPLIDTSSGTNFRFVWYGCSGLTSFPLIDTSSGTSFQATWAVCSGLTSFPLIDTSSGTSFDSAWAECSGLNNYDFPTIDMGIMTNGPSCFVGVTLSTTSYSDLLIDIESKNGNSSVSFHGGNSKYNAGGGTARTALINDHSWTITDGGAA